MLTYQVYIHVTTLSNTNSILHSTRREAGGTGIPMALVIGKGIRGPRGWELALQGMPICSKQAFPMQTSARPLSQHFPTQGFQNLNWRAPRWMWVYGPACAKLYLHFFVADVTQQRIQWHPCSMISEHGTRCQLPQLQRLLCIRCVQHLYHSMI